MARFSVTITRRPGSEPQAFEVEAKDIQEASKKIHSVKKYGAAKACEIQIKGLSSD